MRFPSCAASPLSIVHCTHCFLINGSAPTIDIEPFNLRTCCSISICYELLLPDILIAGFFTFDPVELVLVNANVDLIDIADQRFDCIYS